MTVYRINRVCLYNVVGSTERGEFVFLFPFNYSIRLLLICDPFISPYKVLVLLEKAHFTDFVIITVPIIVSTNYNRYFVNYFKFLINYFLS